MAVIKSDGEKQLDVCAQLQLMSRITTYESKIDDFTARIERQGDATSNKTSGSKESEPVFVQMAQASSSLSKSVKDKAKQGAHPKHRQVLELGSAPPSRPKTQKASMTHAEATATSQKPIHLSALHSTASGHTLHTHEAWATAILCLEVKVLTL